MVGDRLPIAVGRNIRQGPRVAAAQLLRRPGGRITAVVPGNKGVNRLALLLVIGLCDNPTYLGLPLPI